MPELATAALTRARLHESLSVSEVLSWFLSAEPLPEQRNRGVHFGQPPLTVYSSERFFIEVLCWLEGSTAIHQHGFSGAFQVLAGSSIHCEYDFADAERVHARMGLGYLRLRRAELLRPGKVRAIPAGPSFIHATFHADRPTVSVVIRTVEDRDRHPQLTYSPPHLAVDPFFEDAVLERRILALDFLVQTEPAAYFAAVDSLAADADPELAYRLLSSGFKHARPSSWFATLATGLGERLGTCVEKLLAVLREAERRERLGVLRKPLNALEPRFVLAAVQNVPTREALLAILQARFPDRPPGALLGGCAEWLLPGSRAALERWAETGEADDALRAAPLLEPFFRPKSP